MKRRTFYNAGLCCLALGAGAFGLCYFGGWLLRAVNSVNPLQISFLESFSIVNGTGEDIEVVPLGMVAVTGRYAPLPRYKNSFPPAIPLGWDEPLKLGSGETAQITYDYDDINFRHLLIKDKQGKFYILDTDKKGTRNTCYGPEKASYIVPPLRELQLAPSAITDCFYGRTVIYEGAKEYPDK